MSFADDIFAEHGAPILMAMHATEAALTLYTTDSDGAAVEIVNVSAIIHSESIREGVRHGDIVRERIRSVIVSSDDTDADENPIDWSGLTNPKLLCYFVYAGEYWAIQEIANRSDTFVHLTAIARTKREITRPGYRMGDNV